MSPELGSLGSYESTRQLNQNAKRQDQTPYYFSGRQLDGVPLQPVVMPRLIGRQ